MKKIKISAKGISTNGNFWARTDINVGGWLVSKFVKPATKEEFDKLVVGQEIEVPEQILV